MEQLSVLSSHCEDAALSLQWLLQMCFNVHVWIYTQRAFLGWRAGEVN